MVSRCFFQGRRETGTWIGAVTFDTGTPVMEINPPSGSTLPSFLPLGTDVLLVLPSGFIYSYDIGKGTAGTLETQVVPGSTGRNIIGIGYFLTHPLLLRRLHHEHRWLEVMTLKHGASSWTFCASHAQGSSTATWCRCSTCCRPRWPRFGGTSPASRIHDGVNLIPYLNASEHGASHDGLAWRAHP